MKNCRGAQLAARTPPVKTQPWPETDIPETRLHIDYAGRLNGYYYLIIVDSFSKWPEVFKYKHPTSRNAISALDEVCSSFGIPWTLVSDNRTAFTGKEFCASLDIEHVTTPLYHTRSNGQAEKFVDTFKQALTKNQGVDTEKTAIQKFLAVYRITPNANNTAKSSPAELMFARKIRSIFDRLLPCPKKKMHNKENFSTKKYTPGDSFLQELPRWKMFLGGWNYK